MSDVRSGKEIDSALRRKGFRREVNGKHIMYHFLDSEQKDSGIRTMMSHGMGGSTLSTKLICEMSRQLRLTKRQFLALIDCTMSEAEYRIVLQQLGLTV
ncbi:MAG: hypothetical protein ACRC10_11805 [Thermoguttaceae bacterium]